MEETRTSVDKVAMARRKSFAWWARMLLREGGEIGEIVVGRRGIKPVCSVCMGE